MPTPIFDNVIILLDEEEKQTGGVLIPDELRQTPRTGTVVSFGKGKQAPDTGVWIEMQIKEGNRVSLLGRTGIPIKLEAGKKHVIVPQDEIKVIF